jgi:hypothetical protein
MRRTHLAHVLVVFATTFLVISSIIGTLPSARAAALASKPPHPTVRAKPRDFSPRFRDGYVLVAFKSGESKLEQQRLERAARAHEVRTLGAGTHLLTVPAGQVPSVVNLLKSAPGVRYAEPDYLSELAATPNDPSFPIQWGYQNTGQSVNGVAGTSGDDE